MEPTPSLARYRALLALLPADFREHWGRDMEELFRHRLEQAGSSRARRVWVWTRAVWDVGHHALRERIVRSPRPNGGGEGMDTALQDLRYAVRALRASPGFALIALATLAVGIGATTATFSVVHAVLLEPLPYQDSERLVVVWPEENYNKAMVALTDEAMPALERVSGSSAWTLTLVGEGEPVELTGTLVSAHHFDLLGVRAALGRTFTPEEGVLGQADVAILSHDLWTRAFGGDPEVLGRTIQLAGAEYDRRTVIGIMPRNHRPVFGDTDLWVPLEVDPALTFSEDGTWFVNDRVAKLAPGATLEQAQAQLSAFALRMQQESPRLLDPEDARNASVQTLRTYTARAVSDVLWVALGAVALVLLIACANVANLLLARGEARRRDLAVRLAVGAGEHRIRRMLLLESALLGAVGGAAGVGMTFGLVGLLRAIAPPDFPRMEGVGVDGPVMLFALAATLAAALVSGVVPALRAAADGPRAALEGSGRSASGRRQSRMTVALIGTEVALAVVVAVGSGLMLRSLERLVAVDPGLRGEGVLTMRPNPPESRYPDGVAFRAYYEAVLERVVAIQGVEAAGAINLLPGTTSNWSFPTYPEGVETAEGSTVPSVNFRGVTADYFETVGIPLVRGRYLLETDRDETESVVVVNEAFVRTFWPGEDAIGKTLRLFSRTGEPLRVVGVVGDVRQHRRSAEPRAELYVSHAQWSWTMSMWLMIRFEDGRAVAHASDVHRAVWEIDPDVPIAQTAELSAVLGESTQTTRFLALLLSGFGMLALALGAVGVFGVTSYVVSRRQSEFGVRVALGSSRAQVLRAAVTGVLGPVAAGLALGLIGARATTGFLESALYGVSASDPLAFASALAVLGGAAAIAALVPSWRATRVDPVSVLNSE